MKKYTRKNLNVKRVLELADLDIREIAAQNEKLCADEYFSKVEQFIENAPQIKDVLSSISKLGETIKALKELEAKLGVGERSVNLAQDTKKIEDLEKIKSILTEIGYRKSNADIDRVCAAIKSDDIVMAETLANKVLGMFSALVEKIESAYSIKKFATIKSMSDTGNESNKTVLLKEALDYWDYEESKRKLRILAVDDVSVVLNTITSILSPHYEVFALKNSSQVEKFLTHTTPELFLLDIEMNEMSGFELVSIIRQFKEHKDTPIIFLTGNASYNNLKEAVALGACDFITKPVNTEILLEKIEKNIVRKKLY